MNSITTLTPANASTVATSAPAENGSKKNDPPLTISPPANAKAATSQIQRHTSGSSIPVITVATPRRGSVSMPPEALAWRAVSDATDSQLCLVAVHAHPDDEASKGAPTVAHYHAE